MGFIYEPAFKLTRGTGFIDDLKSGDYEDFPSNENQQGIGRINIIKVFFCYVLIGFIGWNFFYFIFTSPWFDIKKITINGNRYLSEEAILTQREIVFDGNLFHFDKENASQILLGNPWIQNLSIKKVFPDQIDIHLVERQPDMYIFYDPFFYLVSREGIILSVLSEWDHHFDLYMVTGLEPETKRAGGVIHSPEYQNTKRIIYALDHIFPDQFYKIKLISNQEFLLFHNNNQIRVRIESGQQLIDQWYLLESALKKVIEGNLSIEEINMKYKERLSIILKE